MSHKYKVRTVTHYHGVASIHGRREGTYYAGSIREIETALDRHGNWMKYAPDHYGEFCDCCTTYHFIEKIY